MLSVVDVFRAGADQSDLLTFALKDAYHVIAHGAIGPLDGLNLLIDTGAIPGMTSTSGVTLMSALQDRLGRRSIPIAASLPQVRTQHYRFLRRACLNHGTLPRSWSPNSKQSK